MQCLDIFTLKKYLLFIEKLNLLGVPYSTYLLNLITLPKVRSLIHSSIYSIIHSFIRCQGSAVNKTTSLTQLLAHNENRTQVPGESGQMQGPRAGLARHSAHGDPAT